LSPTLVFDAGVISLFFAGDQRVAEYFTKIDQEKAMGLIAEINLAEYYYKTCQKLGRETADTRYFMLRESKERMIGDESLTRLAAIEECQRKLDLSLADCFALALAKREKAILLTTDTELKRVRDIQARFFEVR
jgi:predicted nucleic acid-binding protein